MSGIHNYPSTLEDGTDTGEEVRKIEEDILRELGVLGILQPGQIIEDQAVIQRLIDEMDKCKRPSDSMIRTVIELTSGYTGGFDHS